MDKMEVSYPMEEARQNLQFIKAKKKKEKNMFLMTLLTHYTYQGHNWKLVKRGGGGVSKNLKKTVNIRSSSVTEPSIENLHC